jgi:hypothetical protein
MNQMNRDSGTGGTWNRPYGSSDPEPSQTPGVEPGGVPPGETPPGESSTSEATHRDDYDRTRGWAKGPLIAIIALVVLVAGFFLAYAISLMR